MNKLLCKIGIHRYTNWGKCFTVETKIISGTGSWAESKIIECRYQQKKCIYCNKIVERSVDEGVE